MKLFLLVCLVLFALFIPVLTDNGSESRTTTEQNRKFPQTVRRDTLPVEVPAVSVVWWPKEMVAHIVISHGYEQVITACGRTVMPPGTLGSKNYRITYGSVDGAKRAGCKPCPECQKAAAAYAKW